MKKLNLFLGLGLFMLLLVAVLAIAGSLNKSEESYAVKAAKEKATLATVERDQSLATFWSIFWPSLLVGAALLIAWLIISEVRHRRRLNEVVTIAKVNTLLPNAAGDYAARITAGGVITIPSGNGLPKPVPNTITYSPHTIYKNEGRTMVTEPPVNMLPSVAELPKSFDTPTFAELLSRGDIGYSSDLLLGFNDGQPLRGTWKNLYSAAIAGMSGSGKTTTVRFVACQSALLGSQFILIDPHGGAGEESLAETLLPLGNAFFSQMQPAIEANEIEAALEAARYELKMRLTDRERPRFPLVVCVDEMTSLMRTELTKPLSGLLQDISQQGRKVGIFALCMGQIWKGSTSGGTELRDSFASAYVHRLKRNQARMLLPTEEAAQVEGLPAGQALFYQTNGDIVPVNIPLTTGLDVVKVAGLIGARNYPEINRKLTENTVVKTVSQSPKTPLDPEAARVVSLFREGHDTAGIVREIWGEQKGANYQRYSKQVQDVLRQNFQSLCG
jgi:hypothetical protein